MKKYLLAFLLYLITIPAFSQWGNLDTITFDKPTALIKIDTSQKDNIWQIGKPQKTFFDSAYSRPNAIVTDTIGFYPSNNVSSFTVVLPGTKAPGGSWNACMVPHVYYWQKFDMDTLKDSGRVEISADMGKTWEPISYYSIYQYSDIVTGNSGGWVEAGPDITPANYCSGNCHDFPYCDTALVRFTFFSDSINNSREGWMIDNIYSTYYECEGIDELSANLAKTNVYPNPANGLVSIQYQLPVGQHMATLQLHNEMGQHLRTENINAASGILQEDVASLSNGVYYYSLSVNGAIMATSKLVVIH